MTKKAIISFTKVDLPWGFLGNMAPFPVTYENKIWKTSEALFQALRFDDNAIKEEIRTKASPMSAKMIAKKFKSRMVIEPMSKSDVEIMRSVVKLKFDQHPEIKRKLINSGEHIIIEDVTDRPGARHMFWGMKKENDQWVGENMMGRILMELRETYLKELNRDTKPE